jgi:aminoglycoside/choline kinase family phosphotransferase
MIEAFLATHGFGAAQRAPLPSDASFRRYERLLDGPEPALLVIAPPPENVTPFVTLARHLGAHGIAVPRILGEAPGLMIVQDLGCRTMAEMLDEGADPAPLYQQAVAALAAWHAVPPPPGAPAWGLAEMQRTTAATLLDWWWPAMFGAPPGDEIRAELNAALAAMLAPFAGGALVHRDYFAANLIPRQGAMGIIDIQDAAIGHPAYDLVSLVEDARRDIPAGVRDAAVARYTALTGAQELHAAMAVHAAQRHLRVAALWVRLARRDHKPHYLAHGPRCWAMLDRALAHPACTALAGFMDRHIPRAERANPP